MFRMWKFLLFLSCLSGYCHAGPVTHKKNMPIIARENEVAPAPMITEPAASQEHEIESAPAPAAQQMVMVSTLTLPSNATSIRTEIAEGFSCANKSYGYYADVENECQIFHVCLPVTYADGKENTFRWSFICPEETIFSQESFTCMRREDMNIDCEESFKYYELNRNFGVIDEERNKNANSNNNNNRRPMPQRDHEPAMSQSLEQKQQQQTVQTEQMPHPPALHEGINAEGMEASPTDVTTAMKPIKKPAKNPKPNRRKPAPMQNAYKHPQATASFTPLRKNTPSIDHTETTIDQVLEAAEAQTPTQTESIQKKTQAPHENAQSPFAQRFNKRPSINKEKVDLPKQESSTIRVELYQQKRKRPALSTKKEPVTTTSRPTQELLSVTEAFQRKTEASAATTHKEELSKSGQLSTGGNIEATKASKKEESNATVESAASEVVPVFVAPADGDLLDALITEKEPLNEVIQINESPSEATILDADESIPAVIVEEEITKSPKIRQPAVPSEVNMTFIASPMKEQSVPTHATDTLSAMEHLKVAKPANVVQMVPAIQNMEDDVLVHQAFTAEGSTHKESMGGFKPVDPAMAAEAEALITDFLNTLMKTENANPKPLLEGSVNVPDKFNKTAEVQETQKGNKPQQPQPEAEKLQEIPLHTIQAAEPTKEIVEESEPPVFSMMLPNPLPEVYQIPVQVIQTPEETVSGLQAEIEHPKEPVTNAATPPEVSLSIDDIVDLVKEHLDQIPPNATRVSTNEKLTEVAEHPSSGSSPQSMEQTQQVPQAEQEAVVMPIYHRTAEVKPETEAIREQMTAESEQTALVTTAADSVKPKRSRLLRSRNLQQIIKTAKMDPRKRRFLFRSDATNLES